MTYPVPTDNLRFHLPLQGTLEDVGPNTYAITASSTPNMSGGGFYPDGVAARFNGNSNRCVFSSTEEWVTSAADWMLTFWFSQDDITTQVEYYVVLRSDGSTSPFALTPQTATNYKDIFLAYPGVSANKRFLLPSRTNGAQYHVALGWDASVPGYVAYVNGIAATILSASSGGTVTDANAIGGDGNAAHPVVGYMANVTLHNRLLTEEEILAMVNYDPSAGEGDGNHEDTLSSDIASTDIQALDIGA